MKKFDKFLVVTMFLLIVILVFGIFYYNVILYYKNLSNKNDKKEESSEIIVIPDQYKTIELSAAGDCTLGTGANFSYKGNFDWWFKEKAKSDYKYFFSGVKDYFINDDYTFVNLEGTFTKSNNKTKKQFNFKGDPSYVNILLEGSVEGVNLANNHTNDYGTTGYSDTKKYLKEANIDSFGYDNVLIKEIKGIKIAFVGYTTVGLWPTSTSEMTKTIKSLKEEGKADIVVANFHWGIELARKMSDSQRKNAHLAIDNGADIVIGHHPHVVQGIENYKGKYIVYSLGNFVFGGNSSPGKAASEAIIAKIYLDYKNNELQNIELDIIPVSISSTSSRNDYKPVPLTGKRKQYLINTINKYSINYKYEEKTIE